MFGLKFKRKQMDPIMSARDFTYQFNMNFNTPKTIVSGFLEKERDEHQEKVEKEKKEDDEEKDKI